MLFRSPLLYRGGEQSYDSTADPIRDAKTFEHVAIRGTDGMPGDVVFRNAGNVRVDLGTGSDDVTVFSTIAGNSTTINSGAGDDQFAVRSMNGDVTLNTEDGSDQILVGNWAGFWPHGGFSNPAGNANGIQARLQIDAGNPTASDTLDVEDTRDTAPNAGVLSSNELMGIFGTGGSIGYSNVEHLAIRLSDAEIGRAHV